MILIAGPCVIENRMNLRRIAKALVRYHEDPRIDFYFKASFDKANRTSLESFRGPGLHEGLRMLEEIRGEFGFKLLTDVHETWQVEEAKNYVDVLQIPAFLCRQTDLLVAAAKSECIVNIKKGQFMNPADMEYSALKVLQTRGIKEATYEKSREAGLWLTERGSSFGYGNLVVDMRSLLIMRAFAPVIFDATHAVQMPGGAGGKSSGKREFVAPLARAAAAVGVDGFFFETHFDPSVALSDGLNMLPLEELQKTIDDIFRIRDALGV
ncbi:MAG: 3-deoxy-8-phosphooctulonate synthase [Campylobacteraceae bacterium 4484_4]|nr:MAG: 3-deoxy-8-phosphooctulonate synthase [Campylobacteraceae bacterium 4484_4]